MTWAAAALVTTGALLWVALVTLARTGSDVDRFRRRERGRPGPDAPESDEAPQ